MTQYLTEQDLIYINKSVVEEVGGTNFGVQYEHGLSLVVEQPRQVVFGHELYDSIWKKAAFIMQKVTKKHIFVDGNKRTAIMAAFYFLDINGYRLLSGFDIHEAESFVLSVTNAPDDEQTMLYIARWLMEKHEPK
ncbi:type II toxin-antitoxin system death-on-curing family toxin [Weissella confusa]|uniref:type II toxin-antitoxin system death-on-curing family toxin n=1 Tax=Weissella confusa TaxID=1583 RepID=UPI0021AE9BB2|nr:type II toxin-antitoxin system death-on-curing family toxin [Weissella confusa]MCS9991203.1 type II toxin-antitoxin system death-on-curing family toxin [Weissella confusa]